MNEYKVKPSSAPLTTIQVNGVPYHYFHSDKLGECRAVLINPDENLPAAPTEKGHALTTDEIFRMERKNALYEELDEVLAYLPNIPLNSVAEYEIAVARIGKLRSAIYEIENK